MSLFRGRRMRLCTLSKVSKTMAGVGHLKRICKDMQRCISRGRRSTRDTSIRCVRRSGRRFPEKGFILEHEIFGFAKMIVRDRCSTSYDLASPFVAGAVL